MAAPILVTKFFIPPTRAELVQRPGLLERLNDGLDRKLTLLSAPAGFGKTTLVSHWLENLRDNNAIDVQPIKIAWLSLDQDDNDPVGFLNYFIAALNQIKAFEANLGQGALNMLQSPQPPSPNTVLISLINELATFPDKIVFVLDDYHLIQAQPIHQAIGYLLENLPPQLHLVIATRQDPNLSLSRLRARDQMTELRAADLRFTASEAAVFFTRVMGLSISLEDISELETRTEGWIAGLQLAAISMKRRKDHKDFIKSFTGGHRLILDYLIEEVLNQQPENVQTFLLKTSILDRMTGPLCDALSGQETGQATLEMLDRANLFIIPLDDEQRWYRYHHLFADLLRQRQRQTQPNQLPILYRKASEWYEHNGLIDEAVYHALRIGDFERAVYLIERHIETIWAQGEYAKLRRWLAGLPDELVRSRPQLSIFQAWELFASGRPDAGERFLQAAESTHDLSAGQTYETEAHTQDQLSSSGGMRIRGRAAAIQAWIAAYRRDNISGLIKHLHQTLEDFPDQNLHWRSSVAITLADTHAFNGDMPAAYQTRLEALKTCEAAGNKYLYMYNSAKLALNLKTQGRLLQVKELCQQRVRLAKESGMSQTAVVGWLLAIWGDVLAEANDLDRALDLANESMNLTEHGGDLVMLGWSCLTLTRILFSTADLAGAEKIVQKLGKFSKESIIPTWIMDLNQAWQSRIWLAQGKLEAAAQWVSDRGLELDKAPSHMSGFKYLALARVLVNLGRWDETTQLLEWILETAETGGDITRVIEVRMLQALAYQAGGDTTQAMTFLEQAITIAEKRGFCRIFVDEGPSMAHLLYIALDRGIASSYVGRLLQAFPTGKTEQVDPSVSQASESGLIEPLSEREIEVLQLIAEGLTNPQIAARLILSLYTIKTHTRNIYSKLGVNNRLQAVDKARTLGILATA